MQNIIFYLEKKEKSFSTQKTESSYELQNEFSSVNDCITVRIFLIIRFQ
jgi:hypothetical protein